jgi:hypothetical protein
MGISQQIGASSLIKPGVIDNAAARPASPYEGQMIYQKDTNQILAYDGTSWIMVNDLDTPPGLQLIKTATLSGSSTDIDDIFDSTFRHYRIVISNVTSSVAEYIGFRMRVSATTADTEYYQAATTTTFGGTVTGNGGSPLTYGRLGYFGIYVGSITADFLAPNIATSTVVNYQSLGDSQVWSGCVQHAVSTAYTGIRILSAAGRTITGNVRVYGYRD